MDGKPSLEDMWKTKEEFGISRKLIDPHNDASYENVDEMYQIILERIKLGRD